MIRDPQVRKAVLRELLLGAHLIAIGIAVILLTSVGIVAVVGSILAGAFSFYYWQERLRLVEGVDYITPVSGKLARESFRKDRR